MKTRTKSALELTDDKAREVVITRLETYLPLEASGYECSTEKVIDVLVKAAVSQQTIESVCQELDEMVDGETIRGYLNQQIKIDELQQLERQVNQALVAGLPNRLWKSKLQIAIDLHDEPFYGHTPALKAFTCGGRAKKGTTRFFRMATAYVIFKNMRVTLAQLFVSPEDELAELVAALLRRLRILGFKVRRLYFDKGFCTIPVLRYVQQSGWPAILACPIRGKTGGTRALCHGRKSYQTTHTFQSQKYGDYCAPVTICRSYTSRKRSKRQQRRAVWLVYVTLNCDLNPKTVRRCYGRRFGIETSYRCMRQVRAWTTSRNAALRFLLMRLGFILVNLWLELRWRFCQVKQKRGPRKIDLDKFRLSRLISFICRAIHNIYGLVSSIQADVPPLGF